MKQLLHILICITIFICSCTQFQLTRTYVYNLELKGTMLDKYVDKENHNTNKFFIEKFDNTTDTFYADDFSNLWTYAEIGDTIIKNAHSLELSIKKLNGENKVFNYDNPSN